MPPRSWQANSTLLAHHTSAIPHPCSIMSRLVLASSLHTGPPKRSFDAGAAPMRAPCTQAPIPSADGQAGTHSSADDGRPCQMAGNAISNAHCLASGYGCQALGPCGTSLHVLPGARGIGTRLPAGSACPAPPAHRCTACSRSIFWPSGSSLASRTRAMITLSFSATRSKRSWPDRAGGCGVKKTRAGAAREASWRKQESACC